MRNTMSKKIIAIVLLAATFGTTTVSAAENITKKETVYVNLDNSGSVEKTTVSDWIHSSKDDKLKIKDYSELDNIVNIKSNEKPIINGNNLRWNISGSDLYYQGTINKDLPINVNIKYYLNGKKISADKLAGKSGKVKIEISIKNNIYKDRNINGENKRIYTMFSTGLEVMLPVDKFKSVKISSGELLSEGNNNVVTFATFPGLKDSLGLDNKDLKDLGLDFELSDTLTIEADVKKFTLQPIMIVSSPEIPDLDGLDKANSIEDLKKTLNEKLNSLNDNYKLLLDGSKQIADGVDNGVKEVSKVLGESEINTVQNLLTDNNKLNSTRRMMNSASALSKMNMNDASEAIKVINRGNNKTQLVKLVQDLNVMNSYSDLLNNTVILLNADGGKLANATVDTLMNYESLSQEGKQVLQNLCSNLADYEKLAELKNLIKELKVTKDGYTNTTNVLNACINQAPGNTQTEKMENFFNSLGTSLKSAADLTSDNTKNALNSISQDVINYANGYMLVDAQLAYAASKAAQAGDPTIFTNEQETLKQIVNGVYVNSPNATSETKQLATSINTYIDGFSLSTINDRVSSDGVKLIQNQSILNELTNKLNSLSTLNPLLNAINQDLIAGDTKNNTIKLIGSLNKDDELLDNLENAILSFSDNDLKNLASILSSINTINEECNKNNAVIEAIKKNLSSDGKSLAISKDKVNKLLKNLSEFNNDINNSQDLINGLTGMLGEDFSVAKVNKITDMGQNLISMQKDLKDSSELLNMANNALTDGNIKRANNLINSLPEIKSKIGALQDGSNKLYNGMKKYNDEGIQIIYKKGTSAALDFDKVMAYKDAIVEQAKDYDTFAGKSKTMDGSVAFVMKTDTIKAPKKEKNKKTIEKKKGALAWLKDLFGID